MENENPQIIAEIAKLNAQQAETIRRLERIERSLDTITALSVEIARLQSDYAALNVRVTTVEGNQGWLVKGIVGYVIASLIALGLHLTNNFPHFGQ